MANIGKFRDIGNYYYYIYIKDIGLYNLFPEYNEFTDTIKFGNVMNNISFMKKIDDIIKIKFYVVPVQMGNIFNTTKYLFKNRNKKCKSILKLAFKIPKLDENDTSIIYTFSEYNSELILLYNSINNVIYISNPELVINHKNLEELIK